LTGSEDHQLVARVVSGEDTDAFGELVRRHQSHVRNFLRKLAGDYTLADDLAQRYAEILDEVGHVADTEERRSTMPVEEIGDLDRFLAVLTEEERVIMVMSYACGLSHREISDATDMPVGTVKSVIFRGKEKIRTSFDIKDHQHG
jgi:RNA polymerase sigma-70 factor (ECF subfamily)